MPRTKHLSILALAFAAAAALSLSRAEDRDSAATDADAVYELRTYTTHPGRLSALHERFAAHTMRLFEKHGMENVVYWTPVDKDDTLVYVLRHKSLEEAQRSWQAFREDPEWIRVKTASEAKDESGEGGPIVKEVVSVYLKATEYSPAPAEVFRR